MIKGLADVYRGNLETSWAAPMMFLEGRFYSLENTKKGEADLKFKETPFNWSVFLS